MRILIVITLVISLAFTRQAFASSADTTFINALIAQAGECEKLANCELEMELGRKAYVLSQAIGFSKGVSAACMRIGSAYFNLGVGDTALIYFKEAYGIRKELKNPKEVTSTCIAMSYVYVSTAKYDSAYAILFDALRINQLAKDDIGIAETYIELGNLSIEYNDLAKAKTYLMEADKIASGLQSNAINIQSSSALGNYFFNIEEYKTALRYFLKVNTLTDTERDKTMYASNLNNIGLSYSALTMYKEATAYFEKGLNAYVKLGMRYDEGNTCFNIGTMYNNMKMPDSAIYYFNRSLSISREIDDKRHILLSYQYLADAYVLKKNFQQAYHYQLLSNQLNDSILNEDKMNSIVEMQTKYETEIKEQQIYALNNQNENRTNQRNGLIIGTILLSVLLCTVVIQRNAVKREKLKSDHLLLNIIPSEIADELKQTGGAVAKQYNHVTVLFTDFVNFTGLSEQMSPTELVTEIHKNFTAFDSIIEANGLEKIKTIGDAYLAVCGLPHETPDHAQRVAKAALEIVEYMSQQSNKFTVRIGIHSGPVVAGIVGVKKFAYDIWGDTVNTASRMESCSEAGKINISAATYELIKEEFNCDYRGKINAKNKGEVDMYFVEGVIAHR
ncbi:MAG: adenylate/guanylate cyclase domain-containing protein [Bacteroidota bacterium]